MTTRMYIDPAEFATSGKFEDYAENVTRVAIYVGGGERTNNLNAPVVGAVYSGPTPTNHSNAVLKITVNPVELDDAQVNDLPQLFKNELAAHVAAGNIIVERPVGAPVTAATIRGW